MNINRLIKDLKNGNNPEENLSVYSQLLLSSYERLTLGKFALNFTEKYDVLAKEEGDTGEILSVIASITRKVGSGQTETLAQDMIRLDDARGKVLSNLDQLEEYLHYFQLYEHIFNRMNYRFEESLSLTDDTALGDKLMSYITEKQDAETVNERIQAVLGELPVRLTNTKFFELLEKGCSCYAGARNDMAENFFARMERCAALPSLERLDSGRGDLYDLAKEFDHLSLNDVDKDQCREYMAKLSLAGSMVARDLSNNVDLLELINSLYIILITQPYTVSEPKECTELRNILRSYMRAVDSGDFLDIDADILGGLSKTVEDQQKYLGEHMLLEDALDSIYEKNAQSIDGMVLGGIYKTLRTAGRLFMTNSRADISELCPYYTVSREAVMARIRKLEEIYEHSFKNCGQVMKRSLISMALDNMPVPFDSLEKVEAYIRQSLASCTEQYERAAVDALLNDFIQSKVV